MAIKNFLSMVWSETLLNSLEKEYIAVKNCNREFERDLKNSSLINVCAIKPVSLFTYSKNSPIPEPEVLSDNCACICASIARAFNFQIDDIDKAQSNPHIMQSAMRQAANALANDADAYVYSLYEDADNIFTNDNLTPDNIIDTIISVREALVKNNVNSNTETVLEVSPEVASIILKANIAQQTNNSSAISNGYIGSVIGFDVYVSNNIARDDSGNFQCFARTKRAISFVEQINSIEAYRPDNKFADAIKGLYYYGGQITYQNELIVVSLAPAV